MPLNKSLVSGPQSTVLSQRAIEWEHWIIHKGEYFISSDRRNLGSNETLNYLFRTGIHGVHLDISAWSAGALDLDIHSAPVIASPFVGTEMAISNHILPLTGVRTPECEIFKDVDIVEDGGNPSLQRFIPIGSGGEILNQSAGREFVFGPNHDYLVHIDNLSNGNIRYSIEFNFYEVLL